MAFRHALAILGVLAVAVVSACTTTSRGEPVPRTTVESSGTGSSSTENGQELPYAGAPKVDDPLDTTRFQQDPCQTLTADQARSLTLPPSGERRDAPFGKACTWENADTRGLVEIHFLDGDPRGLSVEYQAHKDGKTALFEELPPIEGYPAVISNVFDDRASGKCTVVVGASDEIRFEVPVRLSSENIGHKDPCQVAAIVAGLALATIKS
ncbi:DUF3558 domain-containing protein [Actinophytocola sp.]|uniref:DUF3558 domain-containing protein n=1 Tax=Actinophytocola sp. TaxID=1872138 RepID=UPI003899D621